MQINNAFSPPQLRLPRQPFSIERLKVKRYCKKKERRAASGPYDKRGRPSIASQHILPLNVLKVRQLQHFLSLRIQRRGEVFSVACFVEKSDSELAFVL